MKFWLMKSKFGKIPEHFYSGKSEPQAVKTVGELIDQLKRLPRNLPMECGTNKECVIYVYNVNF